MIPVNSGCGYSFTKGLGDLIKCIGSIYIYNIQYIYTIYNIYIYISIIDNIYIWKTCWKIDGIYGICQRIRVINRLRLGFNPALLRWYPDGTFCHMKPWWLRIMIPQLGLQKCTLELWTISQMILHIFWGQLEIKTAASIHTFVTVSSVVFAYGASNDPCVFVIGCKLLLKLMHAQLTSRHWVGVGWGC